MADTEITLWLTPSEPLQSALRSIIRDLAASLDAVAFEPHVTVFCGPCDAVTARSVADQIARQFAPIRLVATGLEHTDRYTKTFYVQFQESDVLRRMSATAARAYPYPSGYSLNPHLSLLYKQLPAVKRQALCQSVTVPRGEYGFDRIRMVETELPINDPGPVQRWRMICDLALTGADSAG